MRDRLPAHLRAGQNFDKLLISIAARFQGLETVLFDLLFKRSLDVATGKQLDGIGQIVDLARVPGQTDTSYRFAIKTRFITLTKSGTVEDVIQAFRNVTGAVTASYTEVYPATFQISGLPTVDVTDHDVAAFINATMQGIKAAGINMILSTITGFTLSQASEVDIDGNGPLDEDEGFGSANYFEPDGGGFARVI
jgi:hypothetical protein